MLCVSSVSPHLSSPFPCSVFFPVAFPPLMFTYLGLGLSRSPCQAASSCRTKSVLPESMAPLSHSQEVQIQWGTLSIATRRRINRVARRLQQLKFKCVQFCCLLVGFFFFDLLRVYAEFFRVWHFLFVFFLFLTTLLLAVLMPDSFYIVCALPVISSIWGWEVLCSVCAPRGTLLCRCVAFSSGCCQGVAEVPVV